MQPPPPIEERFLVARVDDPSAVDERDVVGDLLDVLRVVRREQNRAALVADDVHQLGEDFVPGDRIEAGGRLVEQQQARTPREDEQQRRLDALAVRQDA